MTKSRPFVAPIVVAAATLIGLASCQGSAFRESIEDRLTDSSVAALTAAGIDDVEVWFSGRDATVEAGADSVAAAAGDVVADVDGVRFVRPVGPDGEVDPGTPDAATGEVTPADTTASAGATDPEAGGTAEDSSAHDASDDAGAGDAEADDGEAPEGTAGDEDAGSSDDSGDPSDDDKPAEATAEEEKKAQDDLVKIPNITFTTPDSARLTDDGKKVVRHAADVLAKHPAVQVRIDGHTDHVGSAEHNEKLSQRRADVVMERLIDLGIDPDRLTAKGFGESDPVIEHAENMKELGKNRRVEFTVTPGR